MRSFVSVFLLVVALCVVGTVVAVADEIPAESRDAQKRRVNEMLAEQQQDQDAEAMKAMMADILEEMASDTSDLVKRVTPEQIALQREKVRERNEQRERQRRLLAQKHAAENLVRYKADAREKLNTLEM